VGTGVLCVHAKAEGTYFKNAKMGWLFLNLEAKNEKVELLAAPWL